MSFFDSLAAYLSSEPSLEWVGPDLFIPRDIQETIVQSVPKSQLIPITAFGHLKPFTDALIVLIPTGIVITSIGYLLSKSLLSPHQNDEEEEELEEIDISFDSYIRRPFANQSDDTMAFLQELVYRVPNEEFELIVFLATEASTATALNLAIRMMRLISFVRGKEVTYDDVEQDHVVHGHWYSQFTVSWYFLKSLNSELDRKHGLIINNFQEVHPKSAAILTFRAQNLFDNTNAHLFLIINVEDSAIDDLSTVWSKGNMINKWLSEKLEAHLQRDVIEGIEDQLSARTFLIQRESLATLLSA
ncbi:Hypothetical protein NTJ_12456 [Nesidiocoris tenuis]|uniref:Uncharacterized protein n=1 Tax=Nesidiocoris tenuis TaxID=355587 RepID=A0ABN7B5F7_9HEMI|nr:Hypothetical protein NTJ_12456 [Nesidiocoris tenuis]